jgi:hypothetical protein
MLQQLYPEPPPQLRQALLRLQCLRRWEGRARLRKLVTLEFPFLLLVRWPVRKGLFSKAAYLLA